MVSHARRLTHRSGLIMPTWTPNSKRIKLGIRILLILPLWAPSSVHMRQIPLSWVSSFYFYFFSGVFYTPLRSTLPPQVFKFFLIRRKPNRKLWSRTSERDFCQVYFKAFRIISSGLIPLKPRGGKIVLCWKSRLGERNRRLNGFFGL